jgi:hypothetical protein
VIWSYLSRRGACVALGDGVIEVVTNPPKGGGGGVKML